MKKILMNAGYCRYEQGMYTMGVEYNIKNFEIHVLLNYEQKKSSRKIKNIVNVILNFLLR